MLSLQSEMTRNADYPDTSSDSRALPKSIAFGDMVSCGVCSLFSTRNTRNSLRARFPLSNGRVRLVRRAAGNWYYYAGSRWVVLLYDWPMIFAWQWMLVKVGMFLAAVTPWLVATPDSFPEDPVMRVIFTIGASLSVGYALLRIVMRYNRITLKDSESHMDFLDKRVTGYEAKQVLSDAEVERLKGEIAGYQAQVTKMELQKLVLESKISSLKRGYDVKVAELSGMIATQNAAIESLKLTVAQLSEQRER